MFPVDEPVRVFACVYVCVCVYSYPVFHFSIFFALNWRPFYHGFLCTLCA